jgi:DUF1680 family protein
MLLRIPGWCRSGQLTVNGDAIELSAVTERGYARIRRLWSAGDQVNLVLSMPIERVYSHPDVRANQGRVALQRGPIVYCLEAADNTMGLHRLALPREEEITAQFEPDLLGGVATLTGRARLLAGDRLYGSEPVRRDTTRFKAIPYHVWDHREPGEMLVWLPEI